MKKTLLLIISSFLLFSSLMAYGAETSVFFEPQKPILLTKNQRYFTLQLKANPTTGYQWFLSSYTTPGLHLMKYTFTADRSGRIGAGGIASWSFAVEPKAFIAPSVLTINLIYARPWNVNDQPTQRVVTLLTSN